MRGSPHERRRQNPFFFSRFRGFAWVISQWHAKPRKREGSVSPVTAVPLPNRRSEEWRYSDVEAAASVWPVPVPKSIAIAPGASETRALVQDADEGSVLIRDHVVTVGAGGSLVFHLLNCGGRLGRVTFDVTLHEGAHFELNGAIVGGGAQTLEIVTDVTHAEPGATSRQVVRSVLGGSATGSYLGTIRVARGAQRTDAEQSVKAMLLSRTATANAKPELEIFADDVKCAHGATVGELDAMGLFYMAARGLPPAVAKRLMLQAFLADATAAGGEALEAAALARLEALL
jgi:Fe-S cluster assembly protein SufD